MAYLREIEKDCEHAGCYRRAVVELVSARHVSLAYYCGPCSEAALRRRRAAEEADARTRTSLWLADYAVPLGDP